MKFLSLVCVFYKMCPQHHCCHCCYQCPHHQYHLQVAVAIVVTRGSPSLSPPPSLACSRVAVAIIVARSLAGRRRHRHRSGVTVTTTITCLPLPSSSLTGRCHRGVISILEFSWLGDDAAAGGGGNSMCWEGKEFVYKEGGGNRRDVRRS